MNVSNNHWFVILYLAFAVCDAKETKAKYGPYHLTLASISQCEKPSRPYDENPPIFYNCKVKNVTRNNRLVTLFSQNFTVVREQRNLKLKNKSFLWEDGVWKMNFMLNAGCHEVLLPVMCNAFGIKYNTKKCTFLPGEYLLENLEPNYIQHLWFSSLEYGRSKWRFEALTSSKAALCLEFDLYVQPA